MPIILLILGVNGLSCSYWEQKEVVAGTTYDTGFRMGIVIVNHPGMGYIYILSLPSWTDSKIVEVSKPNPDLGGLTFAKTSNTLTITSQYNRSKISAVLIACK